MKKPNVSHFSDSKVVPVTYYLETNDPKLSGLKYQYVLLPLMVLEVYWAQLGIFHLGSLRWCQPEGSRAENHLALVSFLCLIKSFWCLGQKDLISWDFWETAVYLCDSQQGNFREAGLLLCWLKASK